LIVTRKVEVLPVLKEVQVLTPEPIPRYASTFVFSKIVSTVSPYIRLSNPNGIFLYRYLR
jgi:hypothetical protein